MKNSEEKTTVTVSQLIKDFIFHCRFEKNLSTKTIRAYTIDIHQFAAYLTIELHITEVDNIKKDHLKNYLQHISCFKPKTIKRKIASLKAMFNYLEYENDSYINPFRKIKVRLKEPQILPSVMTLDEVRKILRIMYREIEENIQPGSYTHKARIRNLAIVEILFATGMRVSEVCNLNYEDINLRNGTIKIFGKGSKERFIQVCQHETLTIIRTYYQHYRREIKTGSAFFINRLGLPLSTQSVRLMIKAYVKKAGLNKQITPHTFRHTFATLLLEEDVDIKYIQNMLGHSSIAITQIYTHVNVSKQKKILTAKHPRRKLQMVGNG